MADRLRELIGARGVLPIAGGAFVVVAAFVLFLVVGLAGGDDSGGGRRVHPEGGVSGGLAATPVDASPEPTIDLNRPTVVATRDPNAPVPGASSGDRMVIQRFGISAPLSYKTVGADGVMPNPNTPDDVAFYDFSAWPGLGGYPGQGGNAVFSGHVDSGRLPCKNGTVQPPCQAVFWDLRRISSGDEIEVHLQGRVFRYRVVSRQTVSASNAAWDKIVASTAQESITLITCAGNFDPSSREYDQREVVVAVRIT